MKTDLTTRILLAGILLCLGVLVIQGMDAGVAAQSGRYEIEIIKSRRQEIAMVRTDTATGRMWRSENYPKDPRWVLIAEPGEKSPAEPADE